MAKKHLILNQPKFGDLSQYNYDDTTDDFNYDNSNGLPINNDKFQNKDLYTNAVGSDLNNAIIERNLKPQGISSIKIDKIFIENVVSHDVINIDIRGYLFSYNQFNNIINTSYDSINNALASEGEVVNSRFFRHTRSTLTENSDLGNLTNVEGQTIISNLSTEPPTLSDGLPGQDGYNDGAGYDYNNLSIIDVLNLETMVTRFIDENAFNPLFLVIWMKGDSDRWYEIDERKKRFQVFKIPNLDLFDTDDGGNPVGKVTTFEKEDLSNYSTTGGEADSGDSYYQGNVDHSAAFRVRDLQITITTLAAAKNTFDDSDNYQQYFDLVLPKITFNSDITNPINFLNISPNNQLNNSDSPGEDYSETFSEYFPKTNIGFYDSKTKNLQTNYLDLQSFYENSPILSLQTSAPATIGLDLSFVNTTDLLMETAIVGDYFYFIIDWDDNTDKIKTLDDWLINRPNNLIEVSELQEEDLYIPQRALQGGEQIIYASDSYPSPNPYELFSDSLGFEQQGNMPPFLNASIPTATQACIELGYTGENNFQSDASSTPPGNVYWDNENQQWDTVDTPSAYITNLNCLTPDTIVTTAVEGAVLNHTYTTPGIKTIKSIVFSYDEETNQVGRWKLLKSRFYLDIPINQYPDFDEVGGSDYTTIPWPYTTPVIGGVDKDSKYKKSVQDTLSGGKIIDVDLIDEKFLINDLENDELGKSIKEMDLEQVRYFNTGSYDIHTLLNITPAMEPTFDNQFLQDIYLSTLPFPQYFEEFDVKGDGEITEEDVEIWETDYARADISNKVSSILSDIEEWNAIDLPPGEFVGTIRMMLREPPPDFGLPYMSTQYWDGAIGQCYDDGAESYYQHEDGYYGPGGWNVLFPPGTWDGITSPLDWDFNSSQYFDVDRAAAGYFPEQCLDEDNNRICTGVRHTVCDGIAPYNEGTPNTDNPIYAFNIYNGKPPLGDILPDTFLESVELSINILSNGNFDLDEYNLIKWISGDSFAKSDMITGWTAVNDGAVPENEMIINPDDGGSLTMNSTTNNNLYITSPSNTIISGKTYLVKVDVDYDFNQPVLEVGGLGGGTNGVSLQQGMNEFNWTPIFDMDFNNSGKVIIRRGGDTFPSSFVIKSISVQERYFSGLPTFAGQIKLERSDYPPIGATPYIAMDTYPDMCYDDDGNGFGQYQLWWQMGLNSTEEAGDPNLVCNALFPNTTATILNPDEEGNHPCSSILADNVEIPVFDCVTVEYPEYTPNFEQYKNSEYFDSIQQNFYPHTDTDYWDGTTVGKLLSNESSVGQIFISDNQDKDLRESCKLELNTGELTNKSIYDSSGNSNKGLLIGDYKVKKVRKGEPMRRDSFIKVPKKTRNKDGAL